MSSDRSAKLGAYSIPRLLVEFSAPAIVGMVAQALYNVTDRVFVGQALGPDGIAGVTVAFPCMLVGLAFAMLVGFGGTALISIRLGEQKKAEAEHILGNMAVLLVLLSAALTVLGLLLLDPILVLFGASKSVLSYASDYLRIIIYGAVLQMVGFGLNAAIRGEGNPRIAMFSMLISVAVNAVLTPLFIFGFSWGIQGAAWGTVIGEGVSAVWIVAYFLSGASLLKLRLASLRLNRAVCGMIFAIGMPPFLMQLVASVLQSLMNHQLHVYGGDMAIAVMGIIYSTMMMFAMPVFGLNQGAQPIIGYNYGARQYDRVKRTLEIAVLAATAVISCGFIVVMLFPVPVIRLFDRDDPALIAMGSRAIRIAFALSPVIGFQIVSSSYFQAVGKPKIAALLMLSRQVLLLIPAILVLPYYFGLDGLWAALPASDLGSSLLTGVFLFFELRHLKDRHLAEEAGATQPTSACPPST